MPRLRFRFQHGIYSGNADFLTLTMHLIIPVDDLTALWRRRYFTKFTAIKTLCDWFGRMAEATHHLFHCELVTKSWRAESCGRNAKRIRFVVKIFESAFRSGVWSWRRYHCCIRIWTSRRSFSIWWPRKRSGACILSVWDEHLWWRHPFWQWRKLAGKCFTIIRRS